ncbi:MAG: DUF4430 domain-containing protein [Coprobacillaceae bacterium]
MGRKIQVLSLVLVLFLMSGCGSKKTSSTVAKWKQPEMESIVTVIEEPINQQDQTDEEPTQDTSEDNSDTTNDDTTTQKNTSDNKGSGEQSNNNDQSGGGQNNTPQETTPVVEKITISVDCKTILNNKDKLKAGYESYVPSNGVLISSMTIEITDGMTVLEALKTACTKQGYSIDAQGGYVRSINNLSEFCCGDLSGWMYGVNGSYVNQSASKKTVKNGDVIKWVFSCASGKDVSF